MLLEPKITYIVRSRWLIHCRELEGPFKNSDVFEIELIFKLFKIE